MPLWSTVCIVFCCPSLVLRSLPPSLLGLPVPVRPLLLQISDYYSQEVSHNEVYTEDMTWIMNWSPLHYWVEGLHSVTKRDVTSQCTVVINREGVVCRVQSTCWASAASPY